MIKKFLVISILGILGNVSVLAQQSPAPTDNPHLKHDQKMRECRRQATDLGLQGIDRRAFIAECMKRPIA